MNEKTKPVIHYKAQLSSHVFLMGKRDLYELSIIQYIQTLIMHVTRGDNTSYDMMG